MGFDSHGATGYNPRAMTNVVITGISGRMGATLARLVRADAELQLAAGTERSELKGLDVPVYSALQNALQNANAVIDFTSPEASVEHAKVCAERGVPLVIGSTGFKDEQRAQLAESARKIAIVEAPNMSVGVNLVMQVAAQLATVLGRDFDIEIVESHHRMKKDAPSGTALKIADIIAQAIGRTKQDFRTQRDGVIGERPKNEIGIQTLRGGDVVGEHTVFFYGDGERVELTHRATSRDQFARGALRAVKWLQGKNPGLYDMQDVLGLRSRSP